MKTSTKILIILTILSFVPNIFLTKYLLRAIIPTGTGFVFNFTPLAWVSLAFQILFNVLFSILFFRFLKSQRLSNMIFFSLLPLTVVYGAFMVYITAVKNLDGTTAESVRATLNIATQETSYNNYLWAGLATLGYLAILFVVVLFACRPLARVERITQKLGDGRVKHDDFKVGGGKQFKEIEHSLNKINYAFKENENKIRRTNLQSQKTISKQFFKFFGKNNITELELGKEVKKNATVLLCDLRSNADSNKSLSLEENFNYVNSYLKIVSPLVNRYDGFIDKYLGDGVLAVFSKAQNAIECAHAILKAVDLKNKSKKGLPAIDTKIAVHTGELVFGLVGEEEGKSPTIVSNVLEILNKIKETSLYIDSKLLISNQTVNEIPQNFDFEHRYIGILELEGKNQISLYESLNCYKKSRRDKLKKFKNQFETGVRAYNKQNFEESKNIFAEILRSLPDDKATFVYFNKATEKLKENQ